MGVSEGGDEVGMGGGHDERIFVSVRLRPLNQKEIARNDVSDWRCVNDDTVIYNNANMSMPERSMYPTTYTFGMQIFDYILTVNFDCFLWFMYVCISKFWTFS